MTIKEAIASLKIDAENVGFDTDEGDMSPQAKRFIEAVKTVSDALETTRVWTPCSEGLPTKTADYKVTVQVGSEMGTWRETKIIPYRIVDGVGAWVLPKSDWLIYGVIAWTKEDEPWTGGLDGK